MAHYEPGMSLAPAAPFVARLVKHYDKLDLPPSVFLNINFPGNSGRAYKKYEFTSLGIRQYRDIIIHKTDPRGKPYYWIGGQPKWKTSKGSDFDAVQRGAVSITPLQLNLTDREALERLTNVKLPL
jgi:5'-nucleotidase